MSNWQIKRASIAALTARLNTISVSSVPDDREEASAVERELAIRLEWGDT